VFQMDLARALVSTGAKVGIISVGKYPFRQMLRRQKVVPFEQVDGVALLREYRRMLMPATFDLTMRMAAPFARAAGRLLESYTQQFGRPDLLHAHNLRYAGEVTRRLAELAGLPFVVTEHSTEYSSGLVKGRRVPAYRRVVDAAQSVSAVSSPLARQVESILGYPSGRITVLPNTLPTGFDGPTSFQALNAQPFRFTCVAELVPRKGHALLIDAFQRAFKGKNVELVLVGGGPQSEQLRMKVNALGLQGSVKLVGRLPREEVRRILSKTNVFVLASRAETFGVVIIEALSQGIPVVSTASGGPDALVGAEDGLLVAVDDVVALADALRRIYDEYPSFDRHAIAKRAQDAFSPVSVAWQYRSWYDQVLARLPNPSCS
jgi:glycosyltransferase involved in cell wall biosynthesis